MQDRVPVNPGRVLITPENGSAAYYATMTRADNPTQEGTPLNKASLLKDATAALFGLGSSAVPDDVLVLIKSLIDAANTNADTKAKIATGSYTGTGTYGARNPNSLTLDFAPKILIIGNAGNNTTSICLFLPQYSREQAGWYNGGSMNFTVSGNTVSWYETAYNNAFNQLNYSGTVYPYLAIG